MWAPLLGLAACALVASLAVRLRFMVVTVTGDSMMPALAPGDRMLVRRAGIGSLRRGQMVVVEMPDAKGGWTMPPHGPVGSRRWMVKRVAARPGDSIPDGCLPERVDTAGPLVPSGRFVVLGDNAAWSVDSREIGYIPSERLLGIVVRTLPRSDPDVSASFHNRHRLARPDYKRPAAEPDIVDSWSGLSDFRSGETDG